MSSDAAAPGRHRPGASDLLRCVGVQSKKVKECYEEYVCNELLQASIVDFDGGVQKKPLDGTAAVPVDVPHGIVAGPGVLQPIEARAQQLLSQCR